MYRYPTEIRFHHIDAAGMSFFANAFVLAHDAYEGFVRHIGLDHGTWFAGRDYMFPIRHAQSDYRQPLRLGQAVEIAVEVAEITTSSFRLRYTIESALGVHVVVELVHVCVSAATMAKSPLPADLRERLPTPATR